jgi:competence protein ComEC
VAVVAQGASTPLVGAYFAVVPPLGVVANLLAAPLELVLVAASLLALAVAPLSSSVGGTALLGVALGQWLLDRASAVGGLSSWPFPPLPVALGVALAALALAALTRARFALPAALLLVTATLTWMALPGRPAPSPHRVRVLGVREGMALLVESGGTAVLVDAGRSPGDAWRELARARVRRLDAVVVTHPDADHTGGAAILVERLRVSRLCFPRALAERAEIVALRRVARLAGVEEIALEEGQRLRFATIDCEVLWPPPVMEGADNDASLVARFAVGGARVLIAGDLEASGERSVLARGASPRAEVLQLPHHGSRTSSTQPFLAAVGPVIALAATGTRPRFAYPDPLVVRRVRALPAVLVRQGEGEGSVAWDDAGRIAVGGARNVWVSRQRGGRE